MQQLTTFTVTIKSDLPSEVKLYTPVSGCSARDRQERGLRCGKEKFSRNGGNFREKSIKNSCTLEMITYNDYNDTSNAFQVRSD